MMSRGEDYMGTYPRQAGYDQRVPYPSGGESSAQTTVPSPHHSAGLSRNEPSHRSHLGSRLFPKWASNAPQLGYDQAMAVLSKDETFGPMAAFPSKDQNEDKVDDGPYDPNATVGAQQNSLYVLMKNDNMIDAKRVGEMMKMAGFIWRTIYGVQLPLIRIPEKREEFVHFRMMSLEDKMKALTLNANKKQRKKMKLHFMGKPTHVKDLPVASLPFVAARPGTRQEALDALMPLRGIKYEDQIAARSDSIKNMLKNVVLSVRKTLKMQAGSENQLARCFFDEPELREFIPMGTSTGFARFTTIEFGEHPSTGKPTPGIRVNYNGPDEGPLVYFLPLEDCTHISPVVVRAINDLFGFLTYEGFAIYDPKYAGGPSLFRFRAMMSTSGRMIITVELSLDDNYVGSFEEISTESNSDLPQEPPLTAEYPFMKENSLGQVPPIGDLIKYGGMEHLYRITPALQRFYDQYGQTLGVEGIYITWYYVNERPVEWVRFSKIWHHTCGSDFVSEFIMDVHLPMYPHITTIHFPHTQAFPKILKEIVENTSINRNSRVIVLSEYLFLAEFFGQICSRTIFMKYGTTEYERDHLEKSLPPYAIKTVRPRGKTAAVKSLEPGGDVVIIWTERRRQKVLRNIALANYRLVVLVRDGLKRAQQDKQDTFVSLASIAMCMFPYMALVGTVAIDVEPQGTTMPALISFFSKAPSAPPIPYVVPGASAQRVASKLPGDQAEPPFPPPASIISKQPDYKIQSQPTSVSQSPYYQTPQESSEPPYEKQYPGNEFGSPSTSENKSRLFLDNDLGPRPTPRDRSEMRLLPGNEFKSCSTPGNELEPWEHSRNKFEPRTTSEDEFEPWSTPGGSEPPLHDDEFGTRWPQDTFGPRHPSSSIIEPDNANDFGSDLGWFSSDDLINDADKVKQIMEFVWRNGGHKQISNITPDRSLAGWKMLFNLQKSLRNQRNKGRITFYPFWYHKYLTEYEPNVELPRDLKRPLSLAKDSKRLPAEQPKIPPPPTKAKSSVLESPAKIPRMSPGRSAVAPPSGLRPKNRQVTEDSFGEFPNDEIRDVQFICEYIWKNGGHAGLLKMKLDHSVDGWRLLRNIQKTARDHRRKGESVAYPTWYRKSYIPQFEPFVVLPSEPAGS